MPGHGGKPRKRAKQVGAPTTAIFIGQDGVRSLDTHDDAKLHIDRY
jgi:hypothetical protein